MNYNYKPLYNYTIELNSPITEEQWDMISDVDFDNTEHLFFHTKNGKEVHFYKNAIPIEWLIEYGKKRTINIRDIFIIIDEWRNRK